MLNIVKEPTPYPRTPPTTQPRALGRIGTELELISVIGRSAAMQTVLTKIRKVADSEATVLLLGETGVGKELLARALHDLSPRQRHCLVKVNCAALPAELIESELFGHQKGAFTGAIAQRKGRFELADGGTLFLDEIGELPPAAQAKLLRALQEQEFERVGCSESIKVNVRVIAATNRDLAAMVRAGEFRSDLFYRLCVFPIRIPPLRERREDIPLLARQFLREQARKLNKPLVDIAPRALADLQRHDWPGNIRELQNVIERAAIMSSDPLLEFGDAFDPPFATSANLHKRGTLREIEHSGIVQALLASDWIIEGPKGAAAILGLHPSTLRSRMKKLSITRAER